MRKVFLLMMIVGIAVSMVGLSFSAPNIGDPAPSFSIPDTNLVYHSLSDFNGRIVVLNLWQSS